MNDDQQGDRRPARDGAVQLERVLPPGPAAGVEEIVDGLGLREPGGQPPGRPRLLLNMVATVDGRASLSGRSGGLGGPADRALFHGLRAGVDAVLVGAGTVRAERYGRIIPDAARRRLRVERGLAEEPLACIVSGRLALDAGVPLLADPAARVVILTASTASLPETGAHVEYLRAQHDGRLDLRAGMAALCERFAVRTALCEGGPLLARQLVADGLLDELFLTLSPKLGGGEPSGGEALRILAGGPLDPPVELELLEVMRSDAYLFLRYGVGA
jgi:riboflavin biosynthesis pyrimidine reductase